MIPDPQSMIPGGDSNQKAIQPQTRIGIRARGEDAAQPLPIKMPVARTRPPPSMTFAAAETGGVSM